jgi:hypothetical protein
MVAWSQRESQQAGIIQAPDDEVKNHRMPKSRFGLVTTETHVHHSRFVIHCYALCALLLPTAR